MEMDEEQLELELDDEQSLSAVKVSVVFDNGQVTFPSLDLKFDQQGVKRQSGQNHSQVCVQITSQDLTFGEFLGQGIGGYVQKAIYNPLNIPIAVKSVSINNKDQRHQMLNDLKVQLVGSKSDYIVQCYGAYYEAEEAQIKIILEYMDIGSLRNMFQILQEIQQSTQSNQFIDEYILATISYQILEGISFLHKIRKQVHRDIKPENILINSQGQVKITDFGLSKQLDKTYEIAKTYVGTVYYMSPERLQGEGCQFGGDIWGVGLVILELACGIYPYEQKQKLIDFIMQIQELPPPTLPGNHNFSGLLADFLSKCLCKELSGRQSIEVLLGHEWIQKYTLQKDDFKQRLQNILQYHQQIKNNANSMNNSSSLLSQINADLNSNTQQLQNLNDQ